MTQEMKKMGCENFRGETKQNKENVRVKDGCRNDTGDDIHNGDNGVPCCCSPWPMPLHTRP